MRRWLAWFAFGVINFVAFGAMTPSSGAHDFSNALAFHMHQPTSPLAGVLAVIFVTWLVVTIVAAWRGLVRWLVKGLP